MKTSIRIGVILTAFAACVFFLSPAFGAVVNRNVAYPDYPAGDTILYVTTSGSGTEDGLSWTNAMTLNNAVTEASSLISAGDADIVEIRAEVGTYGINTTLELKNGIMLFGGFDGTETDRNGRYKTNPSWWTQAYTGTSYTRLYGNGNRIIEITSGSGSTSPAVLDGLLFENGSADSGAGVNCSTSVNISNCVFEGNSVTGNGGAASFSGNGEIIVTDCTFDANSSSGNGGAIFSNNNHSITLTRCYFTGNTAGSGPTLNKLGGAISITPTQNGSINTISNCTFDNNKATAMGGAVYFAASGQSNTQLAINNCTFKGNSCNSDRSQFEDYGGAVAAYKAQNLTLANCIMIDNLFLTADDTTHDQYCETGSAPCDAHSDVAAQNSTASSNYGAFDYNGVIIYDPPSTNHTITLNNHLSDVGSGETNDLKLATSAAFNGGYTKTYSLDASSSVTDNATDSGVPDVDQRGCGRTTGSYSRGAYQYNGLPAVQLLSMETSISDTTYGMTADDLGMTFTGFLSAEGDRGTPTSVQFRWGAGSFGNTLNANLDTDNVFSAPVTTTLTPGENHQVKAQATVSGVTIDSDPADMATFYLMGDVNQGNSVNFTDAKMIFQINAGVTTTSPLTPTGTVPTDTTDADGNPVQGSDTDGNLQLDTRDAALILQYHHDSGLR